MQRTRRSIQAAALVGTLAAVFVWGGHAEAWCPFGGIEALYTYAAEGNMICSLGVTNFVALAAVLGSLLVVRRAVCSHLCPLGALSELLGWAGRRLGIRPLRVGPRADAVLRKAKYAVLAAVVVLTWQAGELVFRGYCPAYALLGRHGEDITWWAYAISGAMLAGSLVVAVPFCRWFCPLAAVMNPLARFGLGRVKRDAAACRDCGRCAAVCPMQIPVDRLPQVTAARCTTCLSCVSACPAKGRAALVWGPPERLGRRWPAIAVAGVLLLLAGGAVAVAEWWPMPSFVVRHGELPPGAAAVELRVDDLTCRGRGNLLRYFLQRDDLYRLAGAWKVEAWPGPGWARVRVTYDPSLGSPEAIRQAITQWYYDASSDQWRASPFTIEGYDPLGP